ncbi:hypothetical protein [Streptomyces olivoreticuli]|uniref:hypothetical protein n=1 Tax=Streptomyces olivoreticuli TaxID=68246 RepID=UPI000E223265|nr:hypothetical protein [Streptomyces olivoreticuli]
MPFIAARSSGTASRAALYAALSGNRLPSQATVATLLKWWVGDPLEEEGLADLLEDPHWGWIYRLPSAHEGRKAGLEWRDQYRRLTKAVQGERDKQPAATSVTIPVPNEQQRFIAALRGVLEATGLQETRWLLFGEHTRRVDSYLIGERVPQEQALRETVMTCTQYAEMSAEETLSLYHYLAYLADEARAARVRDRRIARKSRIASSLGRRECAEGVSAAQERSRAL